MKGSRCRCQDSKSNNESHVVSALWDILFDVEFSLLMIEKDVLKKLPSILSKVLIVGAYST